MLTKEWESVLNENVAAVANKVESNTGMIVPPEVRHFLLALLRESFIFREEEWEEREISINDQYKLNDYLKGSLPDTINKSLKLVIEYAAGERQYSVESYSTRVSLISVVASIRDNWCGAFPLCR